MIRMIRYILLSITALYWIMYIGSADSLLDNGYFTASTVLLFVLSYATKKWLPEELKQQ